MNPLMPAVLPILVVSWLLVTLSATKGITVTFKNKGDQSGTLSWVSHGEKHFVGVIKPGGQIGQQTFIGHTFELKVKNLPEKTIRVVTNGDIFFAAGGGDVQSWTVESEPVLYAGPKWETILHDVRAKCEEVFASQPEDKAYFCSPAHDLRMFTKAKFDISDEQMSRIMKPKHEHRLLQNAQQPQRTFNFTDVGFKVERIPKDIHDAMLSFLKRTRTTSSYPESMSSHDAYLSGRDSDTWLTILPPRLQDRIYSLVRQRVHEWTGVPEKDLFRTALFGIRMYHHNAVLHAHVDRVDTHVLSAILVVARGDPEDTIPWPLTILDHDGKAHELADEPGQLILYESATCVHGRITPFRGRELANAFVHFRPDGWPDDYRKKVEL